MQQQHCYFGQLRDLRIFGDVVAAVDAAADGVGSGFGNVAVAAVAVGVVDVVAVFYRTKHSNRRAYFR